MIESLYIQNFQIWKKLLIEFDAINMIVGPSMRGKTAILRALYWIVMSRPSGISIINHDADKCRVKLTLDGDVVSRSRARKSPSVYKLNGKIFRAAGSSVPEEIQNLLNLQEINFQKQFDPMFWITDSPGQISKQLNEIVNLEAIDNSLTIIASRVRNTKSLVEMTERRIVTQRERIESLSWVKDFNSDIVNITALEEKLDNVQNATKALYLVVRQVLPLLEHRQGLEGAISGASRVLTAARALRNCTEGREGLALLVKQIKDLKADKRKIPNLKGLWEDREELIQIEDRYKSTWKDNQAFKKMIAQTENLQNVLDHWNEQLATAERKLRKIKKCPTCGSKLLSPDSSSHLICT